jgi:TM2 domain-containing membrane protein YozV
MRILNNIYLYLLALFSVPLCGKDMVLTLADKFFDLKFYEEAITEYKRYIHFNAATEEESYAYYKIGLAYRNKHNLKKSLEALEASVQAAISDSVREERKIDIAVTYLAEGRYNKSKFVLLKLIAFSNIPEIRRKASFFLGIAHLYCYEWKSARDALEIYFKEGGNTGIAHTVDTLLSCAENINYKSPATAKWLSTLIPGAGQMYAGDVGDGINALLLNGANIYFVVYKLLQEEYGNAYLIYFFLFRRYYFGNIYHARKEAKDYNKRINEQTADSLFNLLQAMESNQNK